MLGEKLHYVSLTNHNVQSAILQIRVSTQKLRSPRKIALGQQNILLEIPSQI